MTRPGALALEMAVQAAGFLPGDGWLQRIAEGLPFGPVEKLLAAVRGTVYARATAQDAGYGIETEMAELDGDIVAAAAPAVEALEQLMRPLMALGRTARGGAGGRAGLARFAGPGADRGGDRRARLADPDDRRLGGAGGPARRARPIRISSTGSRSSGSTAANLTSASTATGSTRPGRSPRRVLKPAHSVVVTSATLRGAEGWESAEARTGAAHVPGPVRHFSAPSPFDYAANSEVLIVTDVKRGDVGQLAGAYSRLIEAAEGGTLGLFTAIQRLKAVHARIADRLARAGPAALRPACRPDRHRHPGRHLPRRSPRLPARHRRAAGRSRRPRPFAPAGGDGGRALAAADRAPRGAAGGGRRHRL